MQSIPVFSVRVFLETDKTFLTVEAKLEQYLV